MLYLLDTNILIAYLRNNDIWIAAVASILNAELITTDKDFSHLNGTFLTVNLINS